MTLPEVFLENSREFETVGRVFFVARKFSGNGCDFTTVG